MYMVKNVLCITNVFRRYYTKATCLIKAITKERSKTFIQNE